MGPSHIGDVSSRFAYGELIVRMKDTSRAFSTHSNSLFDSKAEAICFARTLKESIKKINKLPDSRQTLIKEEKGWQDHHPTRFHYSSVVRSIRFVGGNAPGGLVRRPTVSVDVTSANPHVLQTCHIILAERAVFRDETCKKMFLLHTTFHP